MTTYYVSIGKNEYIVEIINNQFKINGRIVQSKLIELGERGLYLIKHGTWKQELHTQSQGPHKYGIDVNGRHIIAKVDKNKIRNLFKSTAKTSADISAPMPGLILNLQVAEGDQVEEGQVVLVMESMKMQLVLKTSQAGIVRKINVQPRAQTAKGDVLVNIEPLG